MEKTETTRTPETIKNNGDNNTTEKYETQTQPKPHIQQTHQNQQKQQTQEQQQKQLKQKRPKH